MTLVVRRSASRAVETYHGILTRHSLAAGSHYDPDDVTFGRLVAHDEHLLEPGAGFDRHAHRGLVIVTWVVRGRLTHRHRVDGGPERTESVGAGSLQYLVAGSGVEHVERNDADEPLVIVQSWLLAEARDRPSYGVAPGYGFAAQYTPPGGDARVVVTRPRAGQQVRLARQPFVHAYVASGAFTLDGAFTVDGEELVAGDAVRAYDQAAVLTTVDPGDVVTWSMTAGIAPPRPGPPR